MKITVASHAGFCFGVRRATDAVENAIREGSSRIFTLGRLIHNDGYCQSLREAGVTEIAAEDIPTLCERARAGESITVVIRAHGEVDATLRQLHACAAECPALRVLDCTCPFVEKCAASPESIPVRGRRSICSAPKTIPRCGAS